MSYPPPHLPLVPWASFPFPPLAAGMVGCPPLTFRMDRQENLGLASMRCTAMGLHMSKPGRLMLLAPFETGCHTQARPTGWMLSAGGRVLYADGQPCLVSKLTAHVSMTASAPPAPLACQASPSAGPDDTILTRMLTCFN